jgi:adenine phosphoribosyltransferase
MMSLREKTAMDCLKQLIREIPDFPKPGILFYDITTLLKNPKGLHTAVGAIIKPYIEIPVDCVIGIEARGFIFAPTIAYQLNAGFVPARKAKKLPGEVTRTVYDLEYGQETIEIHKDAISPGQKVLIIDDVLATGGTASAVVEIVETLGGKIVGLGFFIELESLKGREKLAAYEVYSVLKY